MSGCSGKFMCSERNLAQSVVSIATLSLAIHPNRFGAGLSHTCLWHTCLCCWAAAVSCASPAELQSRAGSCFSAQVGWCSAVCFSSQKQGQRSTACALSSPVLWSQGWQHTGCACQQGLPVHCHVWVWEHGSAGVGCINSSNKVWSALLLIPEEMGLPWCHVKPLAWGCCTYYEKSKGLEKHFWAAFWMDVFQAIRGLSLQVFTMLIQ